MPSSPLARLPDRRKGQTCGWSGRSACPLSLPLGDAIGWPARPYGFSGSESAKLSELAGTYISPGVNHFFATAATMTTPAASKTTRLVFTARRDRSRRTRRRRCPPPLSAVTRWRPPCCTPPEHASVSRVRSSLQPRTRRPRERPSSPVASHREPSPQLAHSPGARFARPEHLRLGGDTDRGRHHGFARQRRPISELPLSGVP